MGKTRHRERGNRVNHDKRRRIHGERKQVRDIVDDLCYYFHQKGITVHVNASATSNTYYIKLDYGALYSIRISNHAPTPERRNNHRYNIITDSFLNLPRVVEREGSPDSFYFSAHELQELKRTIMDKFHELLTLGEDVYDKRLARYTREFAEHREKKSNPFAVRATLYDPKNRNDRFLNMFH